MLEIIKESDTKQIYQLFTVKVIDELGYDKTMKLMQEAKKAVLNK